MRHLEGNREPLQGLARFAARVIDGLIRLDQNRGCRRLAKFGVALCRHLPWSKRLFPVTAEAVSCPRAAVRIARLLSTVASFQRPRSRALLEAWLRAAVLRAFSRRTPLRAALLLLPTPCELDCPGCFFQDRTAGEFSESGLGRAVHELGSAGVYIVHLIGCGELFAAPHAAKSFLDVVSASHDMLFTVITSGRGITRGQERRISGLPNLSTLISIDGFEHEHDARRGPGSWAEATGLMSRLAQAGKLCAFSCTVTSSNWRSVTSPDFVAELRSKGACLGIYLRLRSPESLVLELSGQRLEEYRRAFRGLAETSPIPIVDQELYEERHGCRAASGAMVAVDLGKRTVSPCIVCDESSGVAFDPDEDGSLPTALRNVRPSNGCKSGCIDKAATFGEVAACTSI